MLGDPITAALIAGSVALSGTGATLAWNIWSWRKERERLRRETERAVDTAVGSTTHPYSVDAILISVNIEATADCTTEKRVVGLSARPGATINSLAGDFRTSGSFAGCETPALLETSRQDVSFSGEFVSEQHYQYRLLIHGGLSEDDPTFNFSFQICSRGGYLLDAAEIRRKWGHDEWPFEFFEELIRVPVSQLEVILRFPEGISIRLFALVTYGESVHVPRDERLRVEQGFSYANGIAKLSLEKPKLGYRYLICWDGTSLGTKHQPRA